MTLDPLPHSQPSRPPQCSIVSWLRTAWAGPIAPVPDATAAGLALALGLSTAAHAGHFALLLKRLPWFLAFLGLAVVTFPAFRLLVRGYLAPRLRLLPVADRVLLLIVAVGLALAVSFWWGPLLYQNLWIHDPGVQPVLSILLAVADVALLALLYALVMAVPVAAPAAQAGASDRSGWAWYALAGVSVVAFVVGGNLFVRWYVGSERAMYYWDYAGYWMICTGYAEQLRTDPSTAAAAFQSSIKDSVYTLFPAIGPSAVMARFGLGRMNYVLAAFNFYLVAVLVASIWYAQVVTRQARGTWLTAVVPLVVVGGFPLIWAPLLKGMLDVGGVALAVLAGGLYLARPAVELGWKRILGIAVTLVALALFRKWFNYWIIAFGLCVGLDVLYRMAVTRPLSLAFVWRAARPAVGIGLYSLTLILSFSFPMVRRIAGHDYAQENIGWHSGRPEWERVHSVLEYVGYGYVGLWVLCLLVLFAFRGYRRIGFFALVTAVVGMGLFLRVQEPWPHHYQLLGPPFLMAVVPGLCLAISRIPWRGIQVSVAGLLVLALFVAMETTFVPEAEETWERARPVVPGVRHRPLVRTDLEEVRRLLAWLDRETAGTNRRYCILASSDRFNQTMILHADSSLGEDFPAVKRIAVLPEKDRLDGFPAALFLSEFVVVAGPPQTHLLRPGEQAVVTVPVESFIKDLDIAGAFEKVPDTFEMDGGITLHVYRKRRPIREDELAAFCERLKAAHPDIPKMFTPPAEVLTAVGR
jgi:hypothetical protein